MLRAGRAAFTPLKRLDVRSADGALSLYIYISLSLSNFIPSLTSRFARPDFVAEHLGPVLSGDHPEVKIFGFDHNKDHVKDWADTLFSSNSTSNDYVDGIAFH